MCQREIYYAYTILRLVVGKRLLRHHHLDEFFVVDLAITIHIGLTNHLINLVSMRNSTCVQRIHVTKQAILRGSELREVWALLGGPDNFSGPLRTGESCEE